MPFTFGAPVALSASMGVNLLALQSTVNGSARLSLLGIEVVDANGNVLRELSYTSESGTRYSFVPEPSTAYSMLIATAFFGWRRVRPRYENNADGRPIGPS